MAQAKDCHALTSDYVKKYREHYHREPTVNRHSARWGFDSVLIDMTPEQARALIDYYFTTPPGKNYSLEWFFYNYDKLLKAMRELNDDKAQRQKLMRESQQRAEEWRLSGKQGIADDLRGTQE